MLNRKVDFFNVIEKNKGSMHDEIHVIIDKQFPEVIAKCPGKKLLFCIVYIENLSVIWCQHGLDKMNQLLDDLIVYINNSVFKLAGRIALDKFSIIIPIDKNEDPINLLEILFSLVRQFCYEHRSLNIFLVIKSGATIYNHGDNIEEIINQGYLSLRACRNKEGQKYSLYNKIEKKIQEQSNKMELACYLQQAYNENRLQLAYQPVIDSRAGTIKNYECLLRIVTKEKDIISAGPLIPIAEEMGFIDLIDNYVLELVVQELKCYPDIKLGMNISNVLTESTLWMEKAKKLLSDRSIASRLTVEITETGIQRDLNKVSQFVSMMQNIGCQIAIDDFGTGYTSFKQLKLLNVDIVKIDGLFIKDIVHNEDSRLFVETLISFAKGFGIKIVAEFVENSEIAQILMELGVDYMQGHYFSKALNYRSWDK